MALGLYIHVPFCNGKCPYCDFYSLSAEDGTKEKYTEKICEDITYLHEDFDTVYFGGGTPSLLGSDRIAKILSAVTPFEGREVTLECNPSDTGAVDSAFSFEKVAAAGVNRISMGLQSAVDSERKALGRRGTVEDVSRAVKRIKNAGIDNISLDLMLGIPYQTSDSLKRSIDFCVNAGVRHISAYMLKIEQGTPFYKMRGSLALPDEDTVCDLYLECCEELEKNGFKQYEISNFALPGFESRHNLKYWNCKEYIGLGPAAHSFYNGKRFYYGRDLTAYLNGCKPVDDGEGGSFEEYAMLALRLTKGLNYSEVLERFGYPVDERIIKNAAGLEKYGLVNITPDSINLTPKGFLVSNSVIAHILNVN